MKIFNKLDPFEQFRQQENMGKLLWKQLEKEQAEYEEKQKQKSNIIMGDI